MTVFNKAFAKDIADVIALMGQSVKVTRLGANVTSGYGVFVTSVADDIVASTLPGVSNAASVTKTLMLQGTVSKQPQVGDYITCSQGQFQINKIEVTNPSGVVCVYKIEVQ